MERVFIPLLGRGETSAKVANAMSLKLVESFENMNADIELSESSSAIVMDCLSIWRCVVAVDTESVDGEATEEDNELIQHLQNLSNNT